MATDCRESTGFIPLTEMPDASKDAACTTGREVGENFLRVDDRGCVHQLLGSHLNAITWSKLLSTLDSVSIDEGTVRASEVTDVPVAVELPEDAVFTATTNVRDHDIVMTFTADRKLGSGEQWKNVAPGTVCFPDNETFLKNGIERVVWVLSHHE